MSNITLFLKSMIKFYRFICEIPKVSSARFWCFSFLGGVVEERGRQWSVSKSGAIALCFFRKLPGKCSSPSVTAQTLLDYTGVSIKFSVMKPYACITKFCMYWLTHMLHEAIFSIIFHIYRIIAILQFYIMQLWYKHNAYLMFVYSFENYDVPWYAKN